MLHLNYLYNYNYTSAVFGTASQKTSIFISPKSVSNITDFKLIY